MGKQIKTINVEIGARIKQARKARNMTRNEFADKVGYSPNFITEVERGHSGLSSESIKAFSIALGVSADSLLFGTESPQFEFVQRQLAAVPPEKLDHVFLILSEVIKCIE